MVTINLCTDCLTCPYLEVRDHTTKFERPGRSIVILTGSVDCSHNPVCQKFKNGTLIQSIVEEYLANDSTKEDSGDDDKVKECS